MALFDVRTVTIAISTSVSSPFAFAGQAIVGAVVTSINGALTLAGAAGIPSPTTFPVSADFRPVQVSAGSGNYVPAPNGFLTLVDVAVAAPFLRWETSVAQTASRAILMIFKEPGRTPAT